MQTFKSLTYQIAFPMKLILFVRQENKKQGFLR